MKLDRYDNSDFDRGAPAWKEALWLLVRVIFFWPPIPWPSSLRSAILQNFGAKIGTRVIIRHGVMIHFPWKLEIGDHVWIGEDAKILNLAEVVIGSHVCISQEAYLCTGSHDFKSENFDLVVNPIRVGDGSWIAARAFIAPGVNIGSGCMIGAGSVVTRSVERGQFAAGNPARVIRPV